MPQGSARPWRLLARSRHVTSPASGNGVTWEGGCDGQDRDRRRRRHRGLAAAQALTQTGWQVTLLEQAPEFGPVGAGITLAPNAVRALDQIGLGEQLRARGMAHGAAGLRTASGRWLLRTSVEELEQRFGVPAFALHRADLHRMLADAVPAASLRIGHRVTSASDDRDQATVAWQGPGGPGTASADLVVAADGVHSRLRAGLFPEHPGPAYAGYVTWRGLVPAQAAPALRPAPAVTETWGRGKRFGIVPLAGGQVYWWYATASLPEGAHADDHLADLGARHRGWHAPIPQLLQAIPLPALLRHDIYHLDTPLPRYVSGGGPGRAARRRRACPDLRPPAGRTPGAGGRRHPGRQRQPPSRCAGRTGRLRPGPASPNPTAGPRVRPVRTHRTMAGPAGGSPAGRLPASPRPASTCAPAPRPCRGARPLPGHPTNRHARR